MRFFGIFAALATATTALAQNATTGTVGYGNITTSATNDTLSFGQRYAVLNLDLINGIVSPINGTAAGRQWINATQTWISAVHAVSPQPLTIFTRIYFAAPFQPELGVGVPFSSVGRNLANVTESSTPGQLFPAFNTSSRDVVIAKTRYYAGAGNALEEILSSYKIDTVILSGVRTSGVILSTAYRLFDLNYKIFVIADNVIESAPDNGIHKAILEGIIPKLGGASSSVISLSQAIAALGRSGPALV